jgi:hypothetical protein
LVLVASKVSINYFFSFKNLKCEVTMFAFYFTT